MDRTPNTINLRQCCREAAAAGQTVTLDSMMRELEGVLDEGSPTQQVAATTWSLATWHHLEVGSARHAAACAIAAHCSSLPALALTELLGRSYC